MQKKTTKTLAKKYQVDPRTIRSWRSQGAPLDAPGKMRAWLALRRQMPSITSGSEPAEAQPVDTDNQQPGAPAALARMEQAELAAHRKMASATRGGDLLEIRAAWAQWEKSVEAVRRLDKQVSQEARQRGELVPRTEVLRGLAGLGHALRVSTEAMLPAIAQSCAGIQDSIDLRTQLRRAGFGCALISFAALESFGCPLWMRDAMSQDLTGATNIAEQDIERISKVIAEAAGAEAEATILDCEKEFAADAARYQKPSAPAPVTESQPEKTNP